VSRCQYCGEFVPQQANRCPKCGAPAPNPALGSANYGIDQPELPRFAASDLINPDSLPAWMYQDGPNAPRNGGQTIPGAGGGASGRNMVQGWNDQPTSRQPAPATLESFQTVRQPAVGQPVSPPARPDPLAPQAFPPAGWQLPPQPPFPSVAQAPVPPQGYANQPYSGYAADSQLGVRQAPQSHAAQLGYGQYGQPYAPQSPGSFAQPPASMVQPPISYQQPPAGFPQPQAPYQLPATPFPQPQTPYPALGPNPQPSSGNGAYASPNAFPPVEQAGMYAAAPQPMGLAARGPLDPSIGQVPWMIGGAAQAQPIIWHAGAVTGR
jgi:hypothetical protein